MGIVSADHNPPYYDAVREYDMHRTHSAYLDRKRKREDLLCPGRKEDFGTWDACTCEKCVQEASIMRTSFRGDLNRIKLCCATTDKVPLCNWCKSVYALERKWVL